jgi:hypothetical protein
LIYAAFTLWLFLILFAGIGVYRLWGKMVKADWLNWVLLPGTVVSEMAYIFGSLITGGEVRRAKLLPVKGASKGENSEPTTETSGGLKLVGSVVASLFSIVACVAAILLLRKLLGAPVIEKFIGIFSTTEVPQELPRSLDSFWSQVEGQVRLLRRMSETWWELDWLNWRVPLFVYLVACLSVRIAPVNRPIRPTLAAAVLIAALIALAGLISKSFSGLMSDVWPLLTYIWANLLFLLAATLLLSGLVRLVRILLGKSEQ